MTAASEKISEARLREIIAECDTAAKSLGKAGDEAEASGKFMSRETHRARARKFADTATALRHLLSLRAECEEMRAAIEMARIAYWNGVSSGIILQGLLKVGPAHAAQGAARGRG